MYNAAASSIVAYPSAFATLSADAAQVQRGRENPASFDDAYPAFRPRVEQYVASHLWGASSEFLILASAEEREQWARPRMTTPAASSSTRSGRSAIPIRVESE